MFAPLKKVTRPSATAGVGSRQRREKGLFTDDWGLGLTKMV